MLLRSSIKKFKHGNNDVTMNMKQEENTSKEHEEKFKTIHVDVVRGRGQLGLMLEVRGGFTIVQALVPGGAAGI